MLNSLTKHMNDTLGFQEVHKFSEQFFLNEIKLLAAKHQVGRDVEEVKNQVDVLMNAIKDSMTSDCDIQMTCWANLLSKLESYKVIKVDPRWFTIIAHAKKRIKSRINNKLSRMAEHSDKQYKCSSQDALASAPDDA